MILQMMQYRFSGYYKSARLSNQDQERKLQIYGLGMAKTGTTSLASMFAVNFRSSHEPDYRKMINLIYNIKEQKIEKKQLQKILLKKDQKLGLDMDSSQLNYFFLQELLVLFPEAQFILTIRNPYAWLDSLLNNHLTKSRLKKWEDFRKFRFQTSGKTHPEEEKILKENKLFTLVIPRRIIFK